MALRNKFIDADQGYLLSFLGGLFMQHMAHFHCHYYTAKYPVCVEFIDFSALLYDKIRGLNLGLCLQSEGTTFSVVPIISYVSSFVVTTGHDYFISIHAPAQGATAKPAYILTYTLLFLHKLHLSLVFFFSASFKFMQKQASALVRIRLCFHESLYLAHHTISTSSG